MVDESNVVDKTFTKPVVEDGKKKKHAMYKKK